MIMYLKDGSKIHIKEKNKGSFTKWCGGNVTNECIQRGKNSSNPKIRKKAIFAQNARRFKHQSGGVVTFDEKLKSMPNLLPEITVKPNREESIRRRWRLEEMIPDKDLRQAYLKRLSEYGDDGFKFISEKEEGRTPINSFSITYDKPLIDTNDYLDRLYNLWQHVGKPSIKNSKDNPFSFIIGKDRPMNSPTGNMYISQTHPSIEAELAHSYQYTHPETKYGKFDSIPFLSGNLPADMKVDDKTAYDRHGTFEHEAHSVIQPQIESYLRGDQSLDQINKTIKGFYARKPRPRTEGRPRVYGELWK